VLDHEGRDGHRQLRDAVAGVVTKKAKEGHRVVW
jgi:hypothetical protein